MRWIDTGGSRGNDDSALVTRALLAGHAFRRKRLIYGGFHVSLELHGRLGPAPRLDEAQAARRRTGGHSRQRVQAKQTAAVGRVPGPVREGRSHKRAHKGHGVTRVMASHGVWQVMWSGLVFCLLWPWRLGSGVMGVGLIYCLLWPEAKGKT
jgi:hypothetical protein